MTNFPKKIAILGATSTIAEATSRKLAERGCRLAIIGRNCIRLEQLKSDLDVHGAEKVSVHVVDLVTCDRHEEILREASDALDGLDGVFLYYGELGDQSTAESDLEEIARLINVNFTSAAQWMSAGANLLKASKNCKPTLLAITSVAADRGRRSNYIYGSAKAGLAVFMQGLSHRLAANGELRAVQMKLGFVRSAMTKHMDMTGPLWADPHDVAKATLRAVESGGPIVYAPWFWRVIMMAVRATPSIVFNKVNL